MAVRLRLGEILKERGLTQAAFAKMSGLSTNSVSTLVNQPAQIRLETMNTLCETLKLEPCDLFERVRYRPYK